MTDRNPLPYCLEHLGQLKGGQQEIERLRAENADLKNSVIAFCGPWAVQHARERGLPCGTLYALHYDILANAGARMADFKRGDDEQ